MEQLGCYLDAVANTLLTLPRKPLEDVAQALWNTYQQDNTIFICGNGGSAATASHFACDLMKWTIHPNQRRVRALAFTDNVPIMTAWSNDRSYEVLFVEQLISHYRPGDLLFAISGSGNSPNVIQAVTWANQQGGITVGLSGFDGGKLAQISQYSLHVENNQMPQVEDAHSAICHALAVWMGKQIHAVAEQMLVEVNV
jgi:D-sedoheptulose 7-phosphate isomerase